MRKGFTLVEVIVVTVLSVIIIGIVSIILTATFRGFRTSAKYSALQNEAVALNQVFLNTVRNASSVEILEAAPASFDESSYYVYSDLTTHSLKLKKPGKAPEELMTSSAGNNQTITFNKLFANTIDTEFKLSEGRQEFVLNSAILFKNVPKNVDIKGVATGHCLSFKFATSDCFLTAFDFLAMHNDGLSVDCRGVVDEVNKTATIKVPLTPDKIASLIPKIEIIGTHITFNTPLDAEYDTTKFDMPMDFSTPLLAYVYAEDGHYKEYTIYVIPAGGGSNVKDLNIIPTKRGVDPLNPDFTVNLDNVWMPTDDESLNAIFELEDPTSDYEVRWYAVDKEEDLDLTKEANWDLVATVQNNTVLDITEANRENIVGRYVFFGATGKSGDTYGEWQYSLNNLGASDNTKTPYVYVQLQFGKIWETTLNEMDYLEGDSFKQKSIESSYSKSRSFRKSYKVDENGNATSSDAYKDSIKMTKVPQTGEYKFTLNLVDKEVNIKGAKSKTNLAYWDLPETELTMANYDLFAVNQYHSYYTNFREFRAGGYASGISVSLKHGAGAIGGFAVNPNANMNVDDGWFKILSGEGYAYNFVYSENIVPKKGTGVRAVDVQASGNTVDFANNDSNIMIGARNITTSTRANDKIPYLFSEINNPSFVLDPTKANNLTIDFYYTAESHGNALCQIDMYKNIGDTSERDTSKKANTMYFGKISKVTGSENYVFNNGLTTIKGAPNQNWDVSDVGFDYERVAFFGRHSGSGKHIMMSAWGYDDVFGNFDFTITNVDTIKQR